MDNQQTIVELLKKNTQGLTIQEISDKSQISRITVTKILALLQGQGDISIREIGQAKLIYWARE